MKLIRPMLLLCVTAAAVLLVGCAGGLYGGGPAMNLSIMQGSTTVPEGGTYPYGAQVSATPVVFTIDNMGSMAVSLSPSTAITLSPATYFSVAAMPASSIPAGGSTTFTITFTPPGSPAVVSSYVTVAVGGSYLYFYVSGS